MSHASDAKEKPESPARRGSPATKWAIALVLVAAGAGVYFFGFTGGKMSRDQAEQLIRAKNRAIGYLENFKVPDSIAAWEALAKMAPNEVMPIRNHALTQLVWLQINREADVEPVREAIKRALEFEEQSPESIWLFAHTAMHPRISQPSTARDQQLQKMLRKAADDKAAAGIKDPKFLYASYLVGEQSMDPAVQQTGHAALFDAWQMEPNNIRLTIDLLKTQAKAKDVAVRATLEHAQELLAPLEPFIRRKGSSALEQLEKAQAALDADDGPDWNQLVFRTSRLHIFVKTHEMTVRDNKAVAPHPLEMMIDDFSDELKQKFPPPAARTAPRPTVWRKMEADFGLPSDAGDIVDVQWMDVDLDADQDIIVLTSKQLVVIENIEPKEAEAGARAWQVGLVLPVPEGTRGMVFGDMDDDRNVLKRGVKSSLADLAGQATPTPSINQAPTPSKRATSDVEDAKKISIQLPADKAPPRKSCHESDLDLVLFGESGVVVMRNNSSEGQIAFELVEQPDGLRAIKEIRDVALADMDHDADLDLIIAADSGIQLWSSVGSSMTFEPINQWSRLPDTSTAIASLTLVDWDRDADIDVIASDVSGEQMGLLENIRHARYMWQSWDGDASRPVAVLEANEDASWDIAFAGAAGLQLQTTKTSPMGAVSRNERQVIASAEKPCDEMLVLDVNNDGAEDMVAWTEGGKCQIQLGLGDATFSADTEGATALASALPTTISTITPCDLDADGDLDLLVASGNTLHCVENVGGNEGHWLVVRAHGTSDNGGRANHTGIGSLIEVHSAGRYLAKMVTSQSTHFGLGEIEEPDSVRIIWPNGVPQVVLKPKLDLAFCEPMVLKGSCPYMYAWDGEKFAFVTDCLWAAPIGLQVADGVQAPCRPWEYLKISGDQLVADDHGNYTLQLTEELWEVAYFDHAELIVVDHPEDVEVFSNEKVGPPTIANFKIHTVTNRVPPSAALDQHGRDVLSTLRHSDGDYLRGFDQRLRQGLVTPHYIELHLDPQAASPEQITLFLTGWIYPTDTSLNLAFAQDPDTDGPQLPSVWTPDSNGVWRQRQAYMGFPGGKTKTIAVDLSDVFESNDYRVRIATTSEIYWDEAFFSLDEPEVELKTTTLPAVHADLHYRGVSRRYWKRRNAPEWIDYNDLQTTPIWPTVGGKFTRYGEVTELLNSADNQMAILGAGDEMTVTFKAPPPPPKGWKRDFLFHCVGWDKDADLNTYFGQTVEPLPFNGMTTYPFGDDEAFPDSDSHQKYLRTYQTRTQSREFWRALRKR